MDNMIVDGKNYGWTGTAASGAGNPDQGAHKSKAAKKYDKRVPKPKNKRKRV